jgi:hypothetical protein
MEWLAVLAAPLGQTLIRWPVLYIFANAGHILSLAMLIGATVILDLRLLGAFAGLPIGETARILSRVAAIALASAILTGAFLFSVQPLDYAANTAFLTKLGLVALGALNALSVRRSEGWKAALAGAPPSRGLRLAAVLSLVIWVAAVLAGRWIGFL